VSGLIEDAVETAAEAVAPEAAIPAKVVGWLFGDGWRVACIGAVLAVGVQHFLIDGLYLRPHIGPVGVTLIDLPGLRPQLATANATIAARDRQISDMLAAEKTARDAQIAANHQPAADSRAIAEQANVQDKQNRPAILSAAAAYAAAHRVPECLRNAAAAQAGGVGIPAGVPGTDQPASGGGGANLSPGMVAITQAEFDGDNRNTADLDALRAAIAKLVERGWVVIDGAGK
jgi:hypothetical protein